MKKESLIKAREIILESLEKSNIDKQDKAELMLNMYHFLNENNYSNNIKILSKKRKG